MKKVLPVKFPRSVSLFDFCKEALRHKYENRIRIIDQDVGGLWALNLRTALIGRGAERCEKFSSS